MNVTALLLGIRKAVNGCVETHHAREGDLVAVLSIHYRRILSRYQNPTQSCRSGNGLRSREVDVT